MLANIGANGDPIATPSAWVNVSSLNVIKATIRDTDLPYKYVYRTYPKNITYSWSIHYQYSENRSRTSEENVKKATFVQLVS